MTGGDALVTAHDLRVVYQRGAQPAIDGIDLEIQGGTGLLVTGERGSGKSTLVRALLGLARFGGEAHVMGAVPGTREATRAVGYGPQGRSFADGHSPRHLVGLVAGLRAGHPVPATVVDAALDAAGIEPSDSRRPTTDLELARRISLACAIAGDPAIVVLDDPWEFPETIAAIGRVLARGGAVIAASFDPGGLPSAVTRTITLAEGRLA